MKSINHKIIFDELDDLIYKHRLYVSATVDEEYIEELKKKLNELQNIKLNNHDKQRLYKYITFMKRVKALKHIVKELEKISAMEIKMKKKGKYTISQLYTMVKNDDFSLFVDEKGELKLTEKQLKNMIKPTSILKDMAKFTQFTILLSNKFPKVMKTPEVREKLKSVKNDLKSAKKKIRRKFKEVKNKK